MKDYQVFSTISPKRWRIVKTVFFVVLGVVILGAGSFVATLTNPNKPNLPNSFHKLDRTSDQLVADTTLSWCSHAVKSVGCCDAPKSLFLTPLSNSARLPMAQQIRAAFYVNWDFNAYYSLKQNADKINMLIPEWFVIGKEEHLVCDIDTAAYNNVLKKKSNISVLPALVPFYTENEEDKAAVKSHVNRIVTDPIYGQQFIETLVDSLKRYGFQGITINFLPEPNALAAFDDFMTRLYTRFHTEGLLVTQKVAPNDAKEFDLKKESTYNDLLFIEAQNQGEVGAIADYDWLHEKMDNVSKQVSSDKVVWCLPSFGLEFSKKGKIHDPLSYRQALAIAENAHAKVTFNKATYNLEFEYLDDDQVPHKVFFTDAASNFNQMRLAEGYGWKGIGMWRMGSEDPRVWQFFDKDLCNDALVQGSFDIHSLSKNIISEDVDYVGDGEVMDIMTTPTEGAIRFDVDASQQIIKEEIYDQLPTSYVVQQFGKSTDKKLVLTFDDGPDEKYTPQVLDILKKEKVPAAFFLIGKNIETNPELTKRIYKEGHEIGNHSFYHPDLDSVWEMRAEFELIRTRRSIESVTGVSTILFRPPYNKYVEPKNITELNAFKLGHKHNYLFVSESIDPLDWQKDVTPEVILERLKEKVKYGHIVLLHDAGGERDATIKALPMIIKYFKSQGYSFVSVAELMGKKRADVMPVIASTDQQFLITLNRTVANILSGVNSTLSYIFYVAIFLAICRLLFMFYYAMKQYLKDKRNPYADFAPPLSIIVPAYNEEMGANSTIASLLNQNYKDFEVVFVDDGSKDNTFEVVKAAYGNHPQVKVMTKPNGGKASALNFGLKNCTHEFVVCIDADTQLDPNALKELAKPFLDPKVGAVAGNVKVGNQVNMLTKWQSIEYTTAQNFDRLAFAYLNCIIVVPGAIGAFRRHAIGSVGWYETDTLAEDCDLTMRIIRKGYKVVQNNEAIAITESPETYKQFLKQRFRWSFGVMQAFWKNKHVLFNRHYESLGMVAFPNILIFGMILPLLAPIADFTLIFTYITNSILESAQHSGQAGAQEIGFFEKYHMLIMYLAFMSVDLVVCIAAFLIQKESLKNLWLMFPQRIVYRPLMYYVVFKSYKKALKGELMGWGVLKRTGSMGQVTVAQDPQPQQIMNTSPSVG
jgi:peptidoglycan-N-acetylglucosamine deacetylase